MKVKDSGAHVTLASIALQEGAPGQVVTAFEHAGSSACGSTEAGTAAIESLLWNGGSLADIEACIASHPLPAQRALTAAEQRKLAQEAQEARMMEFKQRQAEVLFLALRQRASAAVVSAIMTALPGAVRQVDPKGQSALILALECDADADTIRAIVAARPVAALSPNKSALPIVVAIKKGASLPVVNVLL